MSGFLQSLDVTFSGSNKPERQGFRGNFVGFNWYGNETQILGGNPIRPLFDPNVANALETAPALYQFLTQTVESSGSGGWDVPAGDVDLMAHSLGNLVMYDALRINAALGGAPIANNAISIEAAVWADALQSLPAAGGSVTINFTNNVGLPQSISLNAAQLEQETWYGYFSNVTKSLAGGILNSYLPDDFALQWMRRNDWIFRGAFESNPGLQNLIHKPAIRSELTLWGFPTLVSNNAALNAFWQSADPPVGETLNPLAKVNFLATQTGIQNSHPTGWTDENGQGKHSDFTELPYPKIWNWWAEFLANNSAMVVNDEK